MARRPDFLTSPHTYTRAQRTTRSCITPEPEHIRFFQGVINSLIYSAICWALVALVYVLTR